MKKFISLFLVAMLCLAMVPMQAFTAEDDSHVEHSKGCTHPGDYYYKTQVTYIEVDSDTHNKYVIRQMYCSNCGTLLSANIQSITTSAHVFDYPGWHYISSTHAGRYSTHYYEYGRKCVICDAEYTRIDKAACTPYACIDPQ